MKMWAVGGQRSDDEFDGLERWTSSIDATRENKGVVLGSRENLTIPLEYPKGVKGR